MSIFKNRDYRFYDFKGENKIFKQQQQEAYGGATDFANQNSDFANNFMDMANQRFGNQSAFMDIMTSNLGKVFNGDIGYHYTDPATGQEVPAGTPGAVQSGGGAGGGAVRQAGGGGSGGGGGVADPFAGVDINSGFNPSDYTLSQYAKGYGRMERAMRSDAAEQAARGYQNSMDAYRSQALQRGISGSGLDAALTSRAAFDQAAAEGDANRQIAIEMMNRKAQDSRQSQALQTDLQKAMAAARQQTSQWETGMNMQVAQARAAAANAAANRAAAARAAGAQSRAYAAATRNMSQEQARQFAEEMKLKGAQLNSDNFFRGMGVMTGMMNGANPASYGELGLSGLQQGGNLYGNLYNSGSQGMVQTRGGGLWSNLLGGLLGGAANIATGGLSGLASGAMGNVFGGGGSGGAVNKYFGQGNGW